MLRMWSNSAAEQFWSSRKLAFVSTANCTSHVTADFQTEVNERANHDEQEYEEFIAKYGNMFSI